MNAATGDAKMLSESNAQLQLLSALQRQIGTASLATLSGMRAEIGGAVSAAQTIAQQSRTAAGADDKMINLREVTGTTREAIAKVADEVFGKKKLDPYLQFNSPDDEAEYRKREAERQAYIERELAKGTPEGALNASNATLAQLQDARDYGADRSPDFARLLADTTNARDAQFAAMRQDTLGHTGAKAAAPEPEASASDLDAIAATFKAAGVLSEPTGAAKLAGHGLNDLAFERAGSDTGRNV